MRAAALALALCLAPLAQADVTRPQVGKASIYAKKFAHRKMANGRRMDPAANNAASKTLPLGTKALVRNLETGQSAVVTIEDRGPHVPGRIVDLSPATAEKIGIERKEGVAKVEVKPLEVPHEIPHEGHR
jgi:rare lipoprotein A